MNELPRCGGVYFIQNVATEKRYIGVSRNLRLRWYAHLNQLRRERHPIKSMQRDFVRYGECAFECSVLAFSESNAERRSLEAQHLTQLNQNRLYNRLILDDRNSNYEKSRKALLSPQIAVMTAADMRALRKRLGMTQVQLAKALDLKPGTISNYEGARGPYPIPRVVELACERLIAAQEGKSE